MKDIQSQPDDRQIPLDEAGVSHLRYPIVVLDQKNERQHTIADVTMSVSLPHHFKGTHMSRFLEVLNERRGEITMRTLPEILRHLRERLDAESARMEVKFPYFIEKAAPVTGSKGLMDYECCFVGTSKQTLSGDEEDFVLTVKVPVTSLCPCSKAISDYGAHNQRGHVTMDIRTRPSAGVDSLVWIEELVAIAEASGSAPVYPLVKREDERFITMQAYDNPVFVEDMARNVALKLQADPRVVWFRVHIVNDESIHNHNAFARVEWRRPG